MKLILQPRYRMVLFALLAVGLAAWSPAESAAQSSETRMGFSLVAGAGVFVAQDKEYYADIAADLYPEVGFLVDVEFIRAGLKFGLIYRKTEVSEWYEDWYGEHYYYDEFTRAYMPVQAELLIAPRTGMGVSPYVGLSPGAFVSIGDDEDHLFAISVKAGLEFDIEPLLLYGDLRYTFAERAVTYGDNIQAGGFMIVFGGGIRLGTS